MADASSGSTPRGPITSTELMERLARDPEFQRRKRKDDAHFGAMDRSLGRTERPILEDLRSVGVEVDSVWDLGYDKHPHPDTLAVVMHHFESRSYPGRIMNGLGRALGVKSAVIYWDRIKKIWLDTDDTGEHAETHDGAAVALAQIATKKQLDDLIWFLTLEKQKLSRIYFLSPILKLGRDAGAAVLESVRDDPVLGPEASRILQARRRRRNRRS